jgi:hypothetical protein
VKDYTFHFEVKNLLTQFLAAFNDCIVKRYDNDRVAKSSLEVRYVLAPKQRVLYDIVNEQHNITLPVVSVNVTSITRDNDRVFNKIEGFYLPTAYQNRQKPFTKVRAPIPIKIEVAMSIIGKYQLDVDQIISNFAPYNDPYIVLAWKLPNDAGLGYDGEIRSKVLWSGNVSFTPPIDLTSADKYRVVADTSFTIEGWLFKKFEESAPIYVVNTTFYPVDNDSLNYESYFTLSGTNFSLTGADLPNTTDTFSVSGIPTIENIFVNLSGTGLQIPITETTSINNQLSNTAFIVYGDFLNSMKYLLLSSADTSLFSPVTSISTIKQGTISGVLVENYTVITDDVLTFALPYTPQTGEFIIVTANDVGWDSSVKSKNITFNLV